MAAPLPSFGVTVTGGVGDIRGSVAAGELVSVPLTGLRIEFVPNVDPDDFVTWDGGLHRIHPVTGVVAPDGAILHDGEPVLLVADHDGLGVDNLQWQVNVHKGQTLLNSWTIPAQADNTVVDLYELAPVVSTEAEGILRGPPGPTGAQGPPGPPVDLPPVTVSGIAASTLVGRMTVKPTMSRQALIENLVYSLTIAGVWEKLEGLYVFAAHHEQAAKLNWIGSGPQDCTAVNAPVFAPDRGFTGDGSASYLDTNTVGTALERYGANDASFGGYVRTSVSSNTSYLGGATGYTTFINPNNTSGNILARGNAGTGGIVTISNAGDPIGLFAWSRDATTLTVYKDGTSVGSGTVPTGNLPTSTFTFLKYSTNYATHQLAAGFLGQGLTGTEHGALNTALATYLTAVGANV